MEKTVAVEHSIWINAPRERPWYAVTEPQHLNKWYATYYHWDIPALQVGASVKFYNKDDHADMQTATIEVVDPPNKFSLRWQAQESSPTVSLVTTFLLAEENGGTRVTIHESGYEGVPDAERQQWTDATSQGYGMSMENLKAYLEGRSIPH
jgi:uncharacterized protein YndB with AHSA1/START domain